MVQGVNRPKENSCKGTALRPIDQHGKLSSPYRLLRRKIVALPAANLGQRLGNPDGIRRAVCGVAGVFAGAAGRCGAAGNRVRP